MRDPRIVDWYTRTLRAGWEAAAGEPLSADLEAAGLASILGSAESLADQLEHSILDAPWLRSEIGQLVHDWMTQPSETIDFNELRAALEPMFSPARALTISRSETAGAYNGANAAALRSHGWTQVVWLAGDDACEECAALADQVMSIAEYEANATIHPNCSCTCEPYEGEEGDEEDEEEAEA